MPNESTSGFTDQQLQQIREVAEQVSNLEGDELAARMDTLAGQVSASVSETVPSAVASALDSRSGVAQVVTISDEQWALVSESCRMQNTTTLLTPLLVASLVGVLFFMLFSSGFRHG